MCCHRLSDLALKVPIFTGTDGAFLPRDLTNHRTCIVIPSNRLFCGFPLIFGWYLQQTMWGCTSTRTFSYSDMTVSSLLGARDTAPIIVRANKFLWGVALVFQSQLLEKRGAFATTSQEMQSNPNASNQRLLSACTILPCIADKVLHCNQKSEGDTTDLTDTVIRLVRRKLGGGGDH